MNSIKTYIASDMQKLLDEISPFSVGFDRAFQNLRQIAPSTGYPPYNIIKESDEKFIIELAVAGFDKSDLTIEHKPEDNQLVVSAKTSDESKEFYFKGIANRNFSRVFALADDVVVGEASLKNGMLVIPLERVIPEEKKPRTVKIK